MSPSDCTISSRSVSGGQLIPSLLQMCVSRPIIASSGSGLKRNLAQRDAIGGMSRVM